jgi:polysaccharide export outer membrane protein
MARLGTLLFLAFCLSWFLPLDSLGSPVQQRTKPPAPRPENPSRLEYAIGGGDGLQILVWKEPDFSGVFRVRFDGKITMPVVGDVSVSGLTPEQVARLLEGQLSRYIETPRVTVSISEANSARIYVIGRVAQQGSFPYTAPIRVVQALALAGGFQEFAKLSSIFVIREVKGKLIYYPVDYDDLVNRRRLDVNIPLLPGDTIVVP